MQLDKVQRFPRLACVTLLLSEGAGVIFIACSVLFADYFPKMLGRISICLHREIPAGAAWNRGGCAGRRGSSWHRCGQDWGCCHGMEMDLGAGERLSGWA